MPDIQPDPTSLALDSLAREQMEATLTLLRDEGRILSRERLDALYALFRERFGPAVLADMDGPALLERMHSHGNRDSLVYWLEFKNDDEFPTMEFGSIAGGSALKFGFYRRAETGAWMTGSPTAQREISTDEAVALARRNRDQLLRADRLLADLPEGAGLDEYQVLAEAIQQAAPDVADSAWGHKYLYLLNSTKLDDFHSSEHQRFHLLRLLFPVPRNQGRYLPAAWFIAAARELGVPTNHLTCAANRRDGEPYRTWRLGTREGDSGQSHWEEMKAGGFAAVGWPHIGDLSDLRYDNASKERLRTMLQASSPTTSPQLIGRETQQLFNFCTVLSPRDLVAASDGARVLGIGRITGSYRYEPGARFPHRRDVEWLEVQPFQQVEHEGLRTTLAPLVNPLNLVAIERRILGVVPLTKGEKPGEHTVSPQPKPARALPPLEPAIEAIRRILDRKGQVILHGPPGTGKTWWALRTARELAAREVFGAIWDDLSEVQRQRLAGGDYSARVRICTFHPAFGYEDFIEGFRPVAHQAQVGFELRDGIFKALCDDAAKEPTSTFYLVVDEINRGDIPRIFGELLTLLELSKRGEHVLLPLSARRFAVPPNVRVIGTMNTADRSIALLDTALRRRFGFVELMPDASLLGDVVIDGVPLGRWLASLNRRIREQLGGDGRNLQVGHAYLLDRGVPLRTLDAFRAVLAEDILPLLAEYCYGDFEKLSRILGREMVDLPGLRYHDEILAPGRGPELVAALQSVDPTLSTSPEATQARTPDGDDEPDPEEDDA